jgi:hypothetical protein
MKESIKLLSLSYRGDSAFGFYYLLDSQWQTMFNLPSQNLAANIETFLVASFDGYYQFYVSSDDTSWLYGRRSTESNEKQIVRSYYTYPNQIYGDLSNHRSSMIFLFQGEICAYCL